MKTFALCLTLILTLSVSRPAKAMIGAFALHPIALAGLVVTAGGMYGAATLIKMSDRHHGVMKAVLTALGMGVGFIGAMGFALLDGEEGQTVSFKEITPEESKKLDITEAELESFNAEIDQANFLLEEALSELAKIQKPTEADSVRIWTGLKEQVSPETFSAMQKIVIQN